MTTGLENREGSIDFLKFPAVPRLGDREGRKVVVWSWSFAAGKDMFDIQLFQDGGIVERIGSASAV